MTPMAQLLVKPNATPSGPYVWPFVKDLTQCPSVRSYKRMQLASTSAGVGL